MKKTCLIYSKIIIRMESSNEEMRRENAAMMMMVNTVTNKQHLNMTIICVFVYWTSCKCIFCIPYHSGIHFFQEVDAHSE